MIRVAAIMAGLMMSTSLISSCTPECLDSTAHYTSSACHAARAEHANRGHRERLRQLDARRFPEKSSAEKKAHLFYKRGRRYYKQGKYKMAIKEYDNAIRLVPKKAYGYANRGDAYRMLGQQARALKDLNRALSLTPEYSWALRARAYLFYSRKNYGRALADLDNAIRFHQSYAYYNAKAWMLATIPVAAFRNGREAVRLAEKAVKQRNTAEYRDTLAAAYAENGQFTKAVGEMRRAIKMLGQKNVALKPQFESRMKLYQQRRPYRVAGS